MPSFRTRAASLMALAAALVALPAQAEEGFYQYPVVSGDTLVFASEGDLWRAPRSGGAAIRLTNHVEEESFPQISPDGTMVAFNAGYDSSNDVYVMPLAGGAPKRLTFFGGFLRTVGWTPDGKVIFASRRERGGAGETLFTVDPKGGDPVAIPLWRASQGVYGSDARTLFFVRRGIASSNDNAAQYRGGNMAELWRWDGGDAEAVRLLADFGAPASNPMALGGRIWFVSDKSGADALWSVAEDGSGVRQESPDLPFPIRQASASGGEVYIQNGADIHAFGVADRSLRKLELDIVSDREQTRLRALDRPLRFLTDATIAPSGKSAVVTARGRVAIGFPEERRRIELPVPLNARARQAQISPDGKTVYLLLDQDLAGGIYRMPADGSAPPTALLKQHPARIWGFELSPDGRTMVFIDKAGTLQKLDLASGTATRLAASNSGDDRPFSDIRFSPDSRHIAYSEAIVDTMSARGQIMLQQLSDGRRVAATSTKYNDYAPAFSADGKWLYFVSDRNFAPTPGNPWGDRTMGVAFPDRGEIYALQLDPKAEFPFRADDELTGSSLASSDTTAPAEATDTGKGKDKAAAKPPVTVVMDGLAARQWKVPLAKGITGGLYASEKFLYARRGDDEMVSIAISKDDPKLETFARGALGFSLADDRKTALVVTGTPDNPNLLLVPAGEKLGDKLDNARVRLSDWALQVDPRAEWQQMFLDAWRLHRDFAYDSKLRGVDWNGVRSRLEPLVARIGHRSELNAILSQMSWNLGILHSQIAPGELPSGIERPAMGYLGAELEAVAGGMRILEIAQSDPDLVATLSPLRRPGVAVREGDIITRIDGSPVASEADVARALAGKVGQEVRLDLSRGGSARAAIVRPVSLQADVLAARNSQVAAIRAAVDRASGGKIGYVAVAAMGANDVAEFARDFFGQGEKPGMIIDVRGNDGGNVDSFLITALMRKAWMYWGSASGGQVTPNMQGAYRGHLAVLIDEQTYSDGETFAAGVKALGLAPLIGQRTAGAGIWLSDRNSLTDNGRARIAEYAQYGLDGAWMIEGWGVEPDIPVDNLPHAAFEGRDAQLQAAIGYLENKIAREPVPTLVPRPLPPFGTPARPVQP